MKRKRSVFLQFSAQITGYSAFDLEATGLVDEYRRLLESILGPELMAELDHISNLIVSRDDDNDRNRLIHDLVLPSPIVGPVVRALMALWYLGTWNQLPDDWYALTGLPIPGSRDAGRSHTPSATAYVEQLSYRTADAHPPGAKPTGFGSWSSAPIT